MIDPNSTAAALVRTILADPVDPLPRLVFADWLDEADTDSNFAWAKFLRLSVELAHTPMTPHRRSLVEAELAAAGDAIRATLTYRADQFLRYADAVRQILPLRCLTLNLEGLSLPRETLNAWPEGLAREFTALPLLAGPGKVTLAVPDPTDAAALDRMEATAGRRVELLRANRDALVAAIDTHYGEHDDFDHDPALGLSLLDLTADETATPSAALRREAESGPLVRVVGMLLHDALSDRVREITLRRVGPRVEVRLIRTAPRPRDETNADGELWGGLPARLHLGVVARFQLLAGLPVGPVTAEQHGSAHYLHRGRFTNLSVRVTPDRAGPRVTVTLPQPNPEPWLALSPAA